MTKKLIILFMGIVVQGCFLYAQNENDSITKQLRKTEIKFEALPYYSFGKGVGLTSPDSLFQFNIRFRMQNRATVAFNEGEETETSAHIRRLRLRFDGYVGNPKFTYVIQLSFSPGDVGTFEEGENINIIRDAVVFYRLNKHWNIGFGQTKLPGNRQRINSSGALQLTDRSINNSRFNIDRDFGLQIYCNQNKPDTFGYEIKTAISSGNGRNWTGSNNNRLAYTGKIELFPWGNFTKGGAYFEGDVVREPKPKLMLSGVYHLNHGAVNSQGQRGSMLFEERDLTSVFVDIIAKYKGWAFQAAWMMRDTDNPITRNPDDWNETSYVVAGNGFDTQLSYVFPNYWEVIGRFSNSNPKSEINYLMPESTQYSMGVTKYIWEHAFKAQAEITNEQLTFPGAETQSNWYVRFQVELGI